MSDVTQNIKYILEALRQKPTAPGITREKGFPVRRMAGDLLGAPVQAMHDDINYSRYARMQNAMGETPVSYEEWLQK